MKLFFRRQAPAPEIPFDPETQIPVTRSSICTGETVAGFRNREDGRFVEVMLIREPRDLELFKQLYHITEVRREY